MAEETIRFLVGSFSDMLRFKFSVDEDGLFYNERLEIEINKRANFIQSRVNNGSLGGRPKKEEKALGKPNGKPNGKPKNNLIENENENENLLLFDEFRTMYLGSKRGNQTELDNFTKKHTDWEKVLPTLKSCLESQIEQRKILKDSGKFVPEWKMLQTWINQRCWEEILITEEPKIKKSKTANTW
jgi:hypothetical protein